MTRRNVSHKTSMRNKYSKKYNKKNKTVRGGEKNMDIDGKKIGNQAILELNAIVRSNNKKSDSPVKNTVLDLKELSNDNNIPIGSPKFVDESDKIIAEGIHDMVEDVNSNDVKKLSTIFARRLMSGSKEDLLDAFDVLFNKISLESQERIMQHEAIIERLTNENNPSINAVKITFSEAKRVSDLLINELMAKRRMLNDMTFVGKLRHAKNVKNMTIFMNVVKLLFTIYMLQFTFQQGVVMMAKYNIYEIFQGPYDIPKHLMHILTKILNTPVPTMIYEIFTMHSLLSKPQRIIGALSSLYYSILIIPTVTPDETD